MKSNLRFLKIFMVLIAFLVGNFAFAQQKVLTEKEKLANEGLIKIENIATDNNNIVVPPIGYNKALYQFVDFSKHSPKGLLIDNGPFVTNPGGGPGGSDVSLLESPNTSYGSNCNLTLSYYVADDFTATSAWTVDSLVFYGYQTGSTTASTFTGLYVQIWNGDPSLATSSVVWGDLTTNILTSTYWSGCYRSLDLVNTDRPIMCNVAATPGLVLPAGDYWIEWTCTGSLSSGPWAHPISILGQIVTGNAKQWTGAAWADIIDSGSGGAKGLPFLIYGTGGSLPTNDMAMMSILTPITGPNLTATETVSVRVINNGTAVQSNIPVSYTVDGGAAVNEVIPGPINSGEQFDYTFIQTADLSAVQTYAFVSTVSLSGDENPANNSKTKSVTNLGNIILMQNGTMSTCDGTFYDSGGPDGTYQNSENYTLTLAPSTVGAKIKFNFTLFDLENNWDFLKVYDGPDATAPMIGNFTGTTIPAALVELVASPANASGAITFNFTSDGSGTYSGWVAAISCVLPLTHDLAASSVSGNVTPTSGTSSDYTVTVTNAGVQTESGANYTVSLYDANNVLIGTANGIDIAVGQSIPFVIPWTPSATGPTYIYGKVTLAGDQNPVNDQTPNFNVNVQAAGLTMVTIGTGTDLPGSPKTPFDFYWKNSLAESLYFPDEIGQAAGVQITQIGYHNSFTSDITSTPVKIFMGETTVADLTGGWISANDLTLVFDGTAAFPAGINDIIIPLTTPYTYNGGNLVIMTNRPMDTQYYLSTDQFYSTTSTTYPSRTLAVNNDNTLFDPYAPPTGTTPLSLFPNTTLYINGGIQPGLDPPTNLAASVTGQNVHLTWDAPSGGGTTEELIYDDGLPADGYQYIGYTMSSQMSPAGPCKILKLKYYTTLTDPLVSDFEPRVFNWAGTEPGTNILYETTANAVDQGWTEVDISAQNILVDGDFMVGFGSITSGVYMGYNTTDNGRAWDYDNANATWSQWNETYFLRAVVEYTDGRVVELSPVITPQGTKISHERLVNHPRGAGIAHTKAPIPSLGNRALLGYNAYRDDTKLNTSAITDLFYDDMNVAAGTYNYTATAVYNEGESVHTSPVEVTIESSSPNIYATDFESFTAGGQVACQDPVNWTTWSNAPCGTEDAYVSTDFAHGGVNGVKDELSNDLVLPMGNKTAGKYEFSFWMYIPTNCGGYYNLLHNFAGSSSEWGLEFYFTDAGSADLHAGGVVTSVPYIHDQWFKVTNNIDLDNDQAEVLLDDVSVYTWQWSLDPTNGTAGLNQLSAVDFFSGSGATGIVNPLYYFDDLVYKEIVVTPSLYATDFESFTAGGQVACQDPVNWTTWSNAPCSPTEDAYVSTDFAHSGVNSVKDEGVNDLVLYLGNKTTGSYEFDFSMYIPTDFCGYYNILQDFAGTSSTWGLEVYFHTDGSGIINAGGNSAAIFSYNHDLWLPIKNVIDLDNDQAELYIDGNLIYTWQWSLGATGSAGINQLSAVDFFAGADANYTTDVPKYYFDDVDYKAMAAPAVPRIVVTPASLSQDLMPNTTATQTLNIANTGGADLTYNIDIAYNVKSVKVINHNAKYERVIENVPMKGGQVMVEKQGSKLIPSVVNPADIAMSSKAVNKFAPQFSRATVYYNQTGNPSAEGAIASQNFTDMPTYACQGADDFVVPSGATWNVNHVFVNGIYYNGGFEVPAADVIFYADAAGIPGAALYTFTAVPAVSDATGNVNVFLPSTATLTAGTYWVSVAAAMDYTTHFQWMWSKEAAPTVISEFQWQNPGDGFGNGYTTWTSGSIVWSGTLDQNLSFALTDSAQAPPPEGWLAANPLSGTVPAGGNVDIEVAFDATGLPLGTYNGNLAVSSNDPAHPVTDVPATLTVKVPGQMPLIEDWASNSFTTNEWTFDPDQSNWSVSTTGNPAPSAQFSWSPSITNYSVALVSRMLDASAITDNVTLKFDINLNNFSTSTLEGMAVEVFDGSAWQMVHDYQNTNGSFGWISESYNITQWAAGHTFSVRFRAYGENSYNINYWYVDNIKVYQQVVGNLAGTVTLSTGGAPVEGALITIKNALSGTYTATTSNFGTYAINGAEAGDYALTVAKEGYNVVNDNVTIVGNQTVTKDYQLTAPTISVDPTSVTVNVPVGGTTTSTVTLHNDGDGPLAWTGSVQSNKKQISIPASNGNFEHTSASAGVAPVVNKVNVTSDYKGPKGSIAYGFDVNNGIFMSFDMDDPANATTIANVSITPFGGTFDVSNTDFMYVIDYNDGAIKKVDIATGNVTTVGAAGLQSGDTPTGLTCDKLTGILYASSTNGSESMLYTIDPATGASTVVGPTGIPALIDIAIDGTGQMYGYDIVNDNAFKIDKTNGTSTVIGSIGFDASYAQGMCWDPATDAIYMAAYNASSGAGELRLFDRVTGNTAVLGSLPGEIDGFAFPGSVSGWASIDPPSGNIAPGGSQDVIITFDGSYIPPQKDLTVTGNLVFNSDPNVGQAIVALSMTIQGPFFGVLTGTVTHGGTPVEGVTVTATREESPVYVYSMVTGADGTYSFPSTMYGTYDITATKEGYNPYEALGIVVTGDLTTTHAIAMVAPIMVIDPAFITDSADFGQIITRTIHVTNNGDGSLEWTGKTIPNNKLQVSIPASNGNFEHTSASAGVAPVVNKTNVTSAYKGAKGSIAYGFDVNNGIFMSFDMDDPSNPTTIANVTITPFGGTFDPDNTDFMYVIDYNDGAIKKVDIATGNVTTVGAAGLQSGDTPTGLTCDKTDGTLYAASTNGSESMLYTIDPATGASTVVGPTGIPALIDIAIDGDGQMYGYDIVGDNAYKIDKTNGTSTVIGSIGFDASYAQGMCWDPESDVIYMAAYNASTGAGELRLFDKLTGSTAVLGSLPGEIDAFAFPGGASKWLSIDPKTGILPPGTTQDVTVTLDGNYIPPQKDYTLTGNILFTSDPNVATTSVPVTFTVQGDIYGILTGIVSHGGQPVAGVIVTAQKQGTNYSTTSGNNGVYEFPQVLGGSYTVSAEATGYCPFSTTGVVITGGQTTTLDINLTAPTMVITPQEVTVTLQPNQQTDQTIHIANNGDCNLEWASSVIVNNKQMISIPASNGQFPRGTAPVSIGRAPNAAQASPSAINSLLRGSTGYAFDIYPGYTFFSFDTDDPATQNVINSITISPFGGTFDASHTDFMYIIDYNDNHLKKVDVASGNVTDVGLCSSISSGQMWTGIQVDKLTNQMYGVTTDISESYIYTIDMNTAVATVIGPTGIPGCIDIAIDGTGQMYGFDLVGDNSYKIDKSTGTSTMLGSLGYDANYAQGMSWDPLADIVYLAAYNNASGTGELRILDRVSGSTALVGTFGGEIDGLGFPGGGTPPWITVAPTSGIIPPGSSQDVTVHLNSDSLAIGTYTANITYTSEPNVVTINVPVTLNVQNGSLPTVSIANVTAMPGPVSVPVHAANIVDMGSFQFSIEYDPALLTYTGTSSWFAGIDAVTVGNPSPGHLTFVWAAEMQGINIPDGNFFNLDFTWTGTIGQISTLVWSDDPTPREFGDYEGVIFTPSYVNGSVTGGNQQPVLTVTPDNQNVAYPAGNTSFAVANTGSGTMSYTAAVTAGGEWLSITGGGSGGNTGTISVAFTENTSTTPRVGTITVTAPGATGSPKTVTVTQAGFSTEPILTIANIVIQDTGVFTLPVNAMNIVNMGSFQFTIEYDPSLISYTGVSNWYTGIDAVTVGNPSAGHITFVWAADLNGINIPNGNFFDINFNWTAAGASIITPVTWSNDPTPQEFADYDGNIFVPIYVNGSVYYNPNGIPEIGIASNSVYPNPATDVVNIKVSNDIRTVQVMNNLGMIISSATVAQEKTVTLNTSNFSAGTYFVRFVSENGKTTVKKLVIIK